ncbi:MAG: hypothetical protein ABWY80_06665 [Acidimicrobiia bacterium]
MLCTRRARRVAAIVVATLAASVFTLGMPARAANPIIVGDAIDFLRTTQISGNTPATGSGAWDTNAAFPFYTYDAVLAVAEQAQTSSTWSTSQALTAVTNFTNGAGQNPLAFMDLMADNLVTPGEAAKTLVLFAAPLGMSFTAYNPSGDGDTVNLTSLIGLPGPDGAYAPDFAFNDTLYAALATKIITGAVAPTTVAYTKAGQKTDGSWSYDHDSGTTTDADIDTTGLALMALLASGLTADDPAVQLGLHYLADQQTAGGSWEFFGSASTESSSRAMLAIAAAGFDVNSVCWRDTVAPELTGTTFVGADAAMEGFANLDGSIAAPGAFNVTYSTAQSVEGLQRSWLPITRAAPRDCITPAIPPADGGASTIVPAPIVLTPAFTG